MPWTGQAIGPGTMQGAYQRPQGQQGGGVGGIEGILSILDIFGKKKETPEQQVLNSYLGGFGGSNSLLSPTGLSTFINSVDWEKLAKAASFALPFFL